MKFYCVMDDPHGSGQRSMAYLEKAVKARGLEFVPLYAANFDYSQKMEEAVESPCILFRLSTGYRAAALEALLIRQGVVTFYKTPGILYTRTFDWGDTIRLQQAGVPTIPTILNIDRSQDERLAAYVKSLGGFPVILKAAGGSHGASVMRLDSMESLRSVLGFISNRGTHLALRKYIPGARHIRLVVVGDKVVDAIRYLPQPDDFRTNAVKVPQVEPFGRNPDTEAIFQMAERAVSVLGFGFGGVDILEDEQGVAAIAEVNAPCNFARNQMNTGVDVAGAMVGYLLQKAKADHSSRLG